MFVGRVVQQWIAIDFDASPSQENVLSRSRKSEFLEGATCDIARRALYVSVLANHFNLVQQAPALEHQPFIRDMVGSLDVVTESQVETIGRFGKGEYCHERKSSFNTCSVHHRWSRRKA